MSKVAMYLIYDLLGWSLFGLVHSLAATDRFKQYIRFRIPLLFPWYRLFYTVTQTALFVCLWLFLPRPQIIIWQVSSIWYYIFRLIQLVSVILFLWSLRSFSSGEFLGISQVKRYLRSKNIEEDDERYQLNISGLYRVCRHPLYLFTILIFLFEPIMTGFKFVFALALIIYIQVGVLMEEKRLIIRFGDAYVAYKREVSRIWPWKFLKDLVNKGDVN